MRGSIFFVLGILCLLFIYTVVYRIPLTKVYVSGMVQIITLLCVFFTLEQLGIITAR
jgi:hypothetical protein